MLEAETALQTGEIKTPLQCSKWSSERSGSDERSVENTRSSCTETAASSGEDYNIGQSEDGSGVRSDTSEEENSDDSEYCASEQSLEEEDESQCTGDTSDGAAEWEPEGNTSSESSYSTATNSEVCCQ